MSGTSSIQQLNVTNTTDSVSPATGSIAIVNGGLASALDTYTNESIVLPTTGGTATPLVYYEEFVFNTSLNGIWGGGITNIPWTVKFVRSGKSVTMEWTNATAVANNGSFLTTVQSLPTRFLTNALGLTMYIPAYVEDNGAGQLGLIEINTSNGVLVVTATASQGNFSGAGVSGIYGGADSWSLL